MKKVRQTKYNYPIKYEVNNKTFYLPKGSTISNPHPFAGKGTKKVFRNAKYYSNIYGGKSNEWSKCKGTSFANNHKLEVHWIHHPIFGKLRGKIKNVKYLTFFLCLFVGNYYFLLYH